MSEEEKKAIAEIYSIVYHDKDKNFVIVSRTKLNTILALLFKQQKEIEYLKEVKWYYENSTISKDKIREKIEEVKNRRETEIKKYQVSMLGSAIDILQELLKE